ncbi:MAG: TolC family outer membrane protein [Pseudomonadota bacterium]|nr:TolC family outer membrane protein [Pseudomonadota bacterium]
MSLQEAVSEAVTSNPRVEAARASHRATEHVLRQSMGRFLPEINLRAEYGKQKIDRPEGLGPEVNNVWREPRQYTLSFKQVLFDGFDRAYDYYRSQARVSSASYKILARSEAIALESIEAYIDVRRHLELSELARENVRRHERLYETIKASFDGGKASIGDVHQTEERIEAAKSLVAQIAIALESAKAKFRNAVGLEPEGLQRVGYATGLPGSSREVFEYAVANNPRIRASQADVDVAGYDKQQFKSSLYPQLSVEGSTTKGEHLQGTPDRNDEMRAMLVLSWKLFDGGVRINRTLELSEREYEKVADHDAMLRDLRQDIETSWARYSIGASQVAALRRQVEQNEKLITTYLDEYNAGRRSLLDVLDAENTSFSSKFELSNVYSLQLYSSYQLIAQMGVLLDRLGIVPPAQVEYYNSTLPGVAPVRNNRSFTIPPLGD